MALVYGVGFDTKKYKYKKTIKVGGKFTATPEYMSWTNMLKRAYSGKEKLIYPTYTDCSVAEVWHDFQEFAKFYHEDSFRQDGWHLDKDLKVAGNKIYGPDTCAFIPRELNLILLDRAADRGPYVQGVYFEKVNSKFRARCKVGGKYKGLGCFLKEEDAYNAYKNFKQNYVKECVALYEGLIDREVFFNLRTFELPDYKESKHGVD